MKTLLMRALASALAIAVLASPASAALLQYSMTGLYTATWTLDDHPSVTAPDSTFFQVTPGSLVFPELAMPASLYFFVDGAGPGSGGLAFLDANGDVIAASGQQLFTGPTDAPVLISGSFTFDALIGDIEHGFSTVSDGIEITIAPVPAVPEPASWMLMIVGFGAAGAILRREVRVRAA